MTICIVIKKEVWENLYVIYLFTEINFSKYYNTATDWPPINPREGTPDINRQGGQWYFLGGKILSRRYFLGVIKMQSIF